jgi:hypothetical protein
MKTNPKSVFMAAALLVAPLVGATSVARAVVSTTVGTSAPAAPIPSTPQSPTTGTKRSGAEILTALQKEIDAMVARMTEKLGSPVVVLDVKISPLSARVLVLFDTPAKPSPTVVIFGYDQEANVWAPTDVFEPFDLKSALEKVRGK